LLVVVVSPILLSFEIQNGATIAFPSQPRLVHGWCSQNLRRHHINRFFPLSLVTRTPSSLSKQTSPLPLFASSSLSQARTPSLSKQTSSPLPLVASSSSSSSQARTPSLSKQTLSPLPLVASLSSSSSQARTPSSSTHRQKAAVHHHVVLVRQQ
jgi:hypothetical protein